MASICKEYYKKTKYNIIYCAILFLTAKYYLWTGFIRLSWAEPKRMENLLRP